MFRLGILYRVQQFLELIASNRIAASEFVRDYPDYQYVSTTDILETAIRCGWVTDKLTALEISASGSAIILCTNPALRLRKQLRDLLLSDPPPWAGLLTRGRRALLRYANPDTVQCFQAAELFEEGDPDIATWWDGVSLPFEGLVHQNRMETGRKGEWLSILHEEERTGSKPLWIALDNSDAGYDILSCVSKDSSEQLFIEVKSSERPLEDAELFLSRNEWEFLNSKSSAILHLWSFAVDPPSLNVIPLSGIDPEIPMDRGLGQWQNVKIPFNSLEKKT
jgi:Protein NO VEIN, C-terminal